MPETEEHPRAYYIGLKEWKSEYLICMSLYV